MFIVFTDQVLTERTVKKKVQSWIHCYRFNNTIGAATKKIEGKKITPLLNVWQKSKIVFGCCHL